MTAMLAFCACGHLRDEHRGGCAHVNVGRGKLAARGNARCSCSGFHPDDRLRDSEDFIGKVLEKVLAKEGIPVEPVERQEALQVLRIALWKTSQKYDSRSHIRFRVYAYFELLNDAIDHFRSERGRHGQHRVYDQRGLDAWDGDSDGPAGSSGLGGVASIDPGDDPDSWAADGGGLLAEGDGTPAGCVGRGGRGDGRGDQGGDHRAGRRSVRLVGAAAPRARRDVAGEEREGGVTVVGGEPRS